MSKHPHGQFGSKPAKDPVSDPEPANVPPDDKPTRAELETAVASQVAFIIDRPDHYAFTRAHKLYGDRFRVNVHVATTNEYGTQQLTIAQSYFVQFNGHEITISKPPLRKDSANGQGTKPNRPRAPRDGKATEY